MGMDAGSVFFIAAIFLLDLLIRKKFPGFYERIRLPVNVLLSIIVAAYCVFLIYAAYDVLTSGVSGGDKAFFTIFIGAVIAVYGALVTIIWRRWLKERKGNRE